MSSSTLTAAVAFAMMEATSSAACGGPFANSTDYPGNDMYSVAAQTPDQCCSACAAAPECKAWTLWQSGHTCFLKTSSA
eukprot:gene3860-4244_t